MAITQVLDLDLDSYQSNELHGDDRMWQETNCYVDVWIELLHSLGLDPVAALPFTLSSDFDGDQWRFFKYPLADLRSLYGLQVMEMNPWRGVEFHVGEQLGLGRFMTVEVDSWYLPDTAGTAYQREHVKTTIIPNMIDSETRILGYFHNTSYHELRDDDYAGIFRHDLADQPDLLPPYTELIRVDRLRRPEGSDLLDGTRELLRSHLARRPCENPIAALRKQMTADTEWLQSGDMDLFHLYAFATVRQLGANSELAASLLSWLADRGEPTADEAEAFSSVSAGAKTVQFKLARLMAGRATDLAALFEDMERRSDEALIALAHKYPE